LPQILPDMTAPLEDDFTFEVFSVIFAVLFGIELGKMLPLNPKP